MPRMLYGTVAMFYDLSNGAAAQPMYYGDPSLEVDLSDWSTLCDAIATDLTTNVSQLANAVVHKYAPWAPDQLQPDANVHIAIWPNAEGHVEQNRPATNTPPGGGGDDQLDQQLYVLYWEPAQAEGSRLVEDQTADAAILDTHQAVRARFYKTANRQIGGVGFLWYDSSDFPNRPHAARWFRITLRCWRFQDYS